MDKKQKLALGYALAAFGLLILFQGWWTTARTVETLPFSEFQTLLTGGQIAEVQVGPTSLDGRFKTARNGRDYFTTTRVDPGLASELEKAGVTFTGVRESTVLRDLLSWIVPVAFFFGLWMLVIRRMAGRQGLGSMMTVGKSKAKIYVERQVGVTFDDVAGVDEAKRELQEVVAFLRNPVDYSRLGARAPKGVLLVGPPGTGKTLLARAVAGEAGVAFFTISGSEFVEMFVGVGAARVRDLFEQARKAAPCIIFIDELDALGRMRGAGGPYGGNDEKEQTLNQLLTELDGFDPSAGILLLAATNRPEILDPALLRAGRFDRQVLVDRPDKTGRRQILAVHVRHIRLDKAVDLDQVAALTPGLTGADLANLVNEAALLATRRGAQTVTLADFSEAIERLVAGLEKRSRVLSPAERTRVAFHEMGHALVAANLAGVDPVQKISIIPRGIGALGYTLQRPTEERYLMTTADLANRITVLMGGRAAELLRFGEISTGAADDLQRATEIAREMVTRYGMDPALGNRAYAPARQTFLGPALPEIRETSEATTREIDLAVRERVETALAAARAILESRRADLEAGATLLLTREILTADEFPPLKPATPPAAG